MQYHCGQPGRRVFFPPAHAGLLFLAALGSLGAGWRTENFLVTAANQPLARSLAERAETCRRELARDWFGKELPRWGEPCPIVVEIDGRLRPCGETSYIFVRGRPVAWQMNVRGSLTSVLQSVLPHEITHAVFATYFGRPLPRWAEEGACVTVENAREREALDRILPERLRHGMQVRMDELFATNEYPADVLWLYAQSYSLVSFLTDQQGGKQKFVAFLADGVQHENWTGAAQKHYGFGSLSELQGAWLSWLDTAATVEMRHVTAAVAR